MYPSGADKAKLLTTYGLSLLWFPAPVLPINPTFKEKLEKIINWFFWSKSLIYTLFSHPKKKSKRLCIPKECGGYLLIVPIAKL